MNVLKDRQTNYLWLKIDIETLDTGTRPTIIV